MLLIMTVNPGFGGQKLIPYTLDKKCVKAKNLVKQSGCKTNIEVDEINLENVEKPWMQGANIIVAGSAVFQRKRSKKRMWEAFLEKS